MTTASHGTKRKQPASSDEMSSDPDPTTMLRERSNGMTINVCPVVRAAWPDSADDVSVQHPLSQEALHTEACHVLTTIPTAIPRALITLILEYVCVEALVCSSIDSRNIIGLSALMSRRHENVLAMDVDWVWKLMASVRDTDIIYELLKAIILSTPSADIQGEVARIITYTQNITLLNVLMAVPSSTDAPWRDTLCTALVLQAHLSRDAKLIEIVGRHDVLYKLIALNRNGHADDIKAISNETLLQYAPQILEDGQGTRMHARIISVLEYLSAAECCNSELAFGTAVSFFEQHLVPADKICLSKLWLGSQTLEYLCLNGLSERAAMDALYRGRIGQFGVMILVRYGLFRLNAEVSEDTKKLVLGTFELACRNRFETEARAIYRFASGVIDGKDKVPKFPDPGGLAAFQVWLNTVSVAHCKRVQGLAALKR